MSRCDKRTGSLFSGECGKKAGGRDEVKGPGLLR